MGQHLQWKLNHRRENEKPQLMNTQDEFTQHPWIFHLLKCQHRPSFVVFHNAQVSEPIDQVDFGALFTSRILSPAGTASAGGGNGAIVHHKPTDNPGVNIVFNVHNLILYLMSSMSWWLSMTGVVLIPEFIKSPVWLWANSVSLSDGCFLSIMRIKTQY